MDQHLINPNADWNAFCFLCFSLPLCVFWVNSHFTPIPWLLLLCHTVPSLGATPKPSTCSHYCRLFTWHTLKPACILTPAPTACFGASFGLFYPFLAALFQLHIKKKKNKKKRGWGGRWASEFCVAIIWLNKFCIYYWRCDCFPLLNLN